MNNAFLQDPELEPAVKGVLATILTNKDDWQVYPEEIAHRLGISRSSVDRYFRKLEETGYLKVERRSLGRGKGKEVIRFFSDKPFPK